MIFRHSLGEFLRELNGTADECYSFNYLLKPGHFENRFNKYVSDTLHEAAGLQQIIDTAMAVGRKLFFIAVKTLVNFWKLFFIVLKTLVNFRGPQLAEEVRLTRAFPPEVFSSMIRSS